MMAIEVPLGRLRCRQLLHVHQQGPHVLTQVVNSFYIKLQLALRIVAAALTSVAATTASNPAWAAGDRDAGLLLARQWCNGCHIVDASEEGTDAAPSFQSIAQHPDDNQAWVRAWLTSSHPLMPNMNLSREEIDDIVAYLSSLAKR